MVTDMDLDAQINELEHRLAALKSYVKEQRRKKTSYLLTFTVNNDVFVYDKETSKLYRKRSNGALEPSHYNSIVELCVRRGPTMNWFIPNIARYIAELLLSLTTAIEKDK